MFDAKRIGQAIGRQAFEQIQASSLPKNETMTLLQIWTESSQAKLKALAESGQLLPILSRQHRTALDEACELRVSSPHLTQTECLRSAGLPLVL
ncbi:hypothetical protein [Luteimonas changyuni]|uniref:hypothetical protein n=1 Tax=Luteimonas sp. MJ145 TaxID=3129234 RepID=UPI0031BB37A6